MLDRSKVSGLSVDLEEGKQRKMNSTNSTTTPAAEQEGHGGGGLLKVAKSSIARERLFYLKVETL